MEVSIIIPAFNEAQNLSVLIDKIKQAFERAVYDYEIIVVDAGSGDNTLQIAQGKGARAFIQGRPGYAAALREGINCAKGSYIITMDADLSHNPYILKRLFSLRASAHIVIASRYIKGGLANMPLLRRILSVALNKFLSFGLALPLRDMSSGFRVYNAEVFRGMEFSGIDFSVLVEILVRAHINGFKIKEIPFHYQPRAQGKSHAKIIKFGLGFLSTFIKMRSIRNSIASADYDDRAFDSCIPMQRFWQRKRYSIIYNLAGYKSRVLDAGCGSSKILSALPQAVGLDIDFKKLRYNLSLGNPLVNADINNLCFKDGCFDEVICSEVIEHLAGGDSVFYELSRVLKKGGLLILGTPDYSRLSWVLIEWLYKRIIPRGYADKHISRYNRNSLLKKMSSLGFRLESYKYILGSELICRFVKEF